MSEKENILERIVIIENTKKNCKDLLKADKKIVKNRGLYRRLKIKPKRVFTYLFYFVLSLLFMLLPIFIIILLTGMG